MPLPGLLLTPVTLIWGPSVSYNLLVLITPGLLCYTMYRAARLWVPSAIGASPPGRSTACRRCSPSRTGTT